MPAYEDAFCVLGCKSFTGSRGAGLKEERSSLWARLAEVRPRYSEVFSNMVDLTHPVWGSIDTLVTVEKYGIIAPGRFPKLIHDGDVFFGDFIPIIVLVEER